jgi:hypothetical protein
MVELMPSTGVYWYQGDIDSTFRKSTCTLGDTAVIVKSGEKMARYIMGLFYKSDDLVNTTISDAPKPGYMKLPDAIINAVICKSAQI